MVKEGEKCRKPLVAALLAVLSTASASASTPRVHRVWVKPIAGVMTDLAAARSGDAVLVATIPDPDSLLGPGERAHGLTRFDGKGRKLWHIETPGAVRAMALSDDARIGLVSTYENVLFAIDPRGRILWKRSGICRPIPFGKRFICFHDDDAESQVAFELYTRRGEKLLSFPIAHDALSMRVSADERNSVVALVGGEIIFFDTALHEVWRHKVAGEVVDAAVSGGESPRVAVLYNIPGGPGRAQGIELFDAGGESIAKLTPATRLGQVALTPSGEGLVTYGNGVQGQFAAFQSLPSGVEIWHHASPHPAGFASNVIVTQERVIIGFENEDEGAGRNHVLAFGFDGVLRWDVPLPTRDGGYLYADSFSPARGLLTVGTDDGVVSAFRIAPNR